MSQMSPARRPASIHDLLAGLLVAVFLLQSFFASLQKSPVYDEPPHIASGLSYLATGVFRANLQHPPLLKEMSALFLRAAGSEWPRTEEARALIRGHLEALRLAPRMLRKRAEIRRIRRLTPGEVRRLILAHRLSLREVA